MFLTRAALALSLALTPLPALAQSAADDLRATITGWEQRLDGRIGVAVHDSGTGWSWGYRQDERFLMNSTVKVPLCAAVLARVEGGDLALDEMLPVTQDDIVTHAPVTKRHVGSGMTIADLCLATIDQSDNTAANLLFERLGGPSEVTKFLRGIGGAVGMGAKSTASGCNAAVSMRPSGVPARASAAASRRVRSATSAVPPSSAFTPAAPRSALRAVSRARSSICAAGLSQAWPLGCRDSLSVSPAASWASGVRVRAASRTSAVAASCGSR